MGGSGDYYRVWIQFGQALSGINLWIRAPHCWLLLLLCRLMGRLPICCMGGTTAECLHLCFPQSEKQPSLTHLPSSLTLCVCPKERAWRDCEEACSWSSMHGRPTPLHNCAPCLCLCLCQLPELPLPLQLLMVSLLSGQPLSWGQGLKNGSGVHN